MTKRKAVTTENPNNIFNIIRFSTWKTEETVK